VKRLKVKLLYGQGCPQGYFRVDPSCRERPASAAQEWLLAEALREDGVIRQAGRLSFLLRMAGGPNTPLKAAAVEPDDWKPLLWTSGYFAEKPGSCASLLPQLPCTSSLTALSRKNACVYAYPLPRRFLEKFIYAAAAAGLENLVLIDPPQTWLFSEAVLSGGYGSYVAQGMRLPRYAQARVKEEVEFDEAESRLKGGDVDVARVEPVSLHSVELVNRAFGGAGELALTLLEGLEESGYVMSYRAFQEMAEQLGGAEGRWTAARLVLFGYVKVRQAQVELTDKGLYTLFGQK